MIISTQIAVPLILMATILSCWPGYAWLTGFLAVATMMTGLYTGVLAWYALPVLAGLYWSGWWMAFGSRPLTRTVAGGVFIALSTGLAFHSIPGFYNVLVWDQQVVKTASAPFTLYFNVDKPWVGLVLLLTSVPLLKTPSQWLRGIRESVVPLLIMLAVIITAGLASGFIRWQPEWPLLAPWFLINNLMFTAVAEEAFFRGFIQRHLTEYLLRHSLSPFFGILFASLLFGLAHFAGGILYMGLASLAGFFYGWIYYRSDSIEMAVLSHWLLNACHFMLFSYPVAV